MFLRQAAAPVAAAAFSRMSRGEPTRSKMGIATTSYMTVRRYRDTLEFLEHCNSLGAAGIQAQINGDLPRLRARAEQLGMYIEAFIGLPRNGDADAFEKSVQNAQAVGALCVRANAGGRRYEDFSTLDEFDAFKTRSLGAIKAAVPIAEKYRVPLAIENHKDWTLEDLVPILKGYSSEYLGACLDFGNSISLCEDYMQVAEQLVPYAVTTHVKDMGVAPYEDGFLLSELPLGEGFLDLQRMFTLVRQHRPKTNLNLEMITRDPLKVPCFTDRYWATFPNRSPLVLARTMRLVEKRKTELPRITQLSHEEQLAVEARNVVKCMDWSRGNV